MTKYCRECTGVRACGKYHVYVIHLEKDVRENFTFERENPQLRSVDNAHCFYVGMTRHKPECRFIQHIDHYPHRIEYAKNLDAESGTMECSCRGKKRNKIFKPAKGSKFVWGNKIAGRYGMELVPKIFYKYNPLKSKFEAIQKEKDLANDLREEGHGASVGGEEIYKNVRGC